MKHLLLRLLIFAAFATAVPASAVTLGTARVNSYLNQPLDVEIELIGVAQGQEQDLRLRIANPEHFARLGISESRLLSQLKFDVVNTSGRWIVRVRSDAPFNEPYIDFPLQMTWPGGQLVKQYTLLLDPPTSIAPSRVTHAALPTETSPTASDPTRDAGIDRYGPVQSGETLWPIAQKLRPKGITTQQMAMALLRANPQAFIDNNINKLRAGAVLDVPPRGFIEQLGAAEARDAFDAAARVRQAAVATSPRQFDSVSTPAGGTATPPSDATETAKSDPDSEQQQAAQLRIVTKDRREQAAENDTALHEQLLVTMEEIESNRLTTDAIESRLSRMETELQRMQQLVSLKDQQIATLRAEIDARKSMDREAELAEPAQPPAVDIARNETIAEMPILAEDGLSYPAAADTATTGADQVATAANLPAVAPLRPVRNDEGDGITQPWYDEYLWAIWLLLALLGSVALLLLFRRPTSAMANIAMADLPEMQERAPPPYSAARRAESTLARRRDDPIQDAPEAAPDLTDDIRYAPPAAGKKPTTPALEPTTTTTDVDTLELDDSALLGDSLLDESLLDESLLHSSLHDEDQTGRERTGARSLKDRLDYSDDEIESWIKDLGAESDQSGAASANDEALDDDEIPSLLNQIDHRLSDEAPTARSPSALDDTLVEQDESLEDAFTMSLDLARAYLEIGDPDGAKDMLEQALSGTHDPAHRGQIEELLRQIR